MEYRRNTLEKRRGKLHSLLGRKSSAIEPQLYSCQNMNTEREELRQFDDQFRMILLVHEEDHQLIENKVKQGAEVNLSWDEVDEVNGDEVNFT